MSYASIKGYVDAQKVRELAREKKTDGLLDHMRRRNVSRSQQTAWDFQRGFFYFQVSCFVLQTIKSSERHPSPSPVGPADDGGASQQR